MGCPRCASTERRPGGALHETAATQPTGAHLRLLGLVGGTRKASEAQGCVWGKAKSAVVSRCSMYAGSSGWLWDGRGTRRSDWRSSDGAHDGAAATVWTSGMLLMIFDVDTVRTDCEVTLHCLERRSEAELRRTAHRQTVHRLAQPLCSRLLSGCSAYFHASYRKLSSALSLLAPGEESRVTAACTLPVVSLPHSVATLAHSLMHSSPYIQHLELQWDRYRPTAYGKSSHG